MITLINTHPNTNVSVCGFTSGLHRRWVYLEPSQPGSDWGEHPRGCSCTTGHPFVPTYTQCQLDTSLHSEWWEDTNIIWHIQTLTCKKSYVHKLRVVFRTMFNLSKMHKFQSLLRLRKEWWRWHGVNSRIKQKGVGVSIYYNLLSFTAVD